VRRLFSILCRYLVLAIVYEITESRTHIWSQAPFLSQAHYLSLLSSADFTARSYLSLYFIFRDWLMLSSLHECLSLIHIGILGLNDPREWPPLLGSMLEAYIVRRLWANF